MTRIGQVFGESNSDSVAMIVLEGEQPLGDDAHKYYDNLIVQLRADPTHVQHIHDFWGDPLTAAGVQSADGKAAYVQLDLAGNQGQALANESVEAVRKVVELTPLPNGVKTYVTGPAALVADLHDSGIKTVIRIIVVSVVVIFIMSLLMYRSVTTVMLLLAMVGTGLAAVRGIVAFLCHHGVINLSVFAISILVALAIAAETNYGIFLIGRYHEARQAGEDRETAYYTAYRGVARVILASGLTIAGATYCLSFTRLPILQTIGPPCAVGMLVAVAVALTLIPAVLTVAGRFGLLEPKRTMSVRGWRRVGTVIVRWPAPIFMASCAVVLVGLLALPGYRVAYEDRSYIPQDTPANIGWAAADRHFPEARMRPTVLMIESDHDMRNSADFLVLHKLAKAIFGVEGIAQVQGVTRPQGTPVEHMSQLLGSLQNVASLENLKILKGRVDSLGNAADELGGAIAAMERLYALLQQVVGTVHHAAGVTKDTVAITSELRDHIADIDDFFRPIRGYFYWEKHCYDIPICWTLRSAFDSLDGVDQLTGKLVELGKDVGDIDAVTPQLLAVVPPLIDAIKNMQTILLTIHSSMSGIFEQVEQLIDDGIAVWKDFDAALNDDAFYLLRAVFNNPAFQSVVNMFLSPDGKAARFIITDSGNPATEEGIVRVHPIEVAAEESLKGTSLANAKIDLAGSAAVLRDVQKDSNFDLLIAGIASLFIVFMIMLITTRSFIAALVIVGPVALSLGASFGLSVLLWQYILGFNLHWMVLQMSVIILLAVGAVYNLLLVARFKEEIGAGLKTGIIRGMGGTGKVVTTAGLIFAFTMASMVVSDLRVVGQVGTVIGLGVLFNTLVVCSFLTPSLAALLGRWYWRKLRFPRARPAVRHRPVSRRHRQVV